MKRHRHTPEQIVRKLREGGRLLNEGKDITEVVRRSRGRVANRVYVVSDDIDAIEAHGVRRERTDDLLTLREAVAPSAAQEMASRSRGMAIGR